MPATVITLITLNRHSNGHMVLLDIKRFQHQSHMFSKFDTFSCFQTDHQAKTLRGGGSCTIEYIEPDCHWQDTMSISMWYPYKNYDTLIWLMQELWYLHLTASCSSSYQFPFRSSVFMSKKSSQPSGNKPLPTPQSICWISCGFYPLCHENHPQVITFLLWLQKKKHPQSW